jgi:hypothetical protein
MMRLQMWEALVEAVAMRAVRAVHVEDLMVREAVVVAVVGMVAPQVALEVGVALLRSLSLSRHLLRVLLLCLLFVIR